MTSDTTPGQIFQIFTDIGIIEQLSRHRLERRLPDGLMAPHFAVLNHLIRVQNGQTPLHLARAFQVPKTTMTHTLAGLEKKGLAELRPNPTDGRSKCVWLTEAGQTTHAATIAKLAQDFDSLARQFDTGKLSAIAPVLKELREYLDTNRPAD